ncbi:MAG: hypothetical protein HY827_09585 [Actinobacteria bacterium]|nr:hypothetical protein [Actinomycetota bacterium]
MITREGKQARDLAEARLARPVQDSLEAAVVLEAWVGEETPVALNIAPELVRVDATPPKHSHIASERVTGESFSTGLGLVLAVVLVATWAAPISASLGANVWNHALLLSLPVALSLEWMMLARYGDAESGLTFSASGAAFGLTSLLLVAATLSLIGLDGRIASAIVITWVCGAALVKIGHLPSYLLVLAASSGLLYAGAGVEPVIWCAATLSLAIVSVTLRSRTSELARSVVHFRVLGWGMIGAGLGLMLVTDDSIGWGFNGEAPALALIPSAVGSLWGAFYLSRVFWSTPNALTGVSYIRSDRVDIGGTTMRVLGGAVVRTLAASAGLSLLCILLGRWTSGTIAPTLFGAFAAFGLASMLVTLLVSIRRSQLAGAIVCTGLLIEMLLRHWTTDPVPGVLLLLASISVAALASVRIILLFSRPGRALATGLWI